MIGVGSAQMKNIKEEDKRRQRIQAAERVSGKCGIQWKSKEIQTIRFQKAKGSVEDEKKILHAFPYRERPMLFT
ncbi:hypothetical protein [uncultured Allobaculum sp.]|uniref:hypothetical protein n=2 Tax=uncultured Allobaculum sp. TaxID=1187017 RepID=UPI0025A6276F|nr:hypothetical protein [uncultured Allobaculum sp.]